MDGQLHRSVQGRGHLRTCHGEALTPDRNYARRDGIICANETQCSALIAGLRDAGLTVGRDIDRIGNDTSDPLDHVTRPSTHSTRIPVFAGEELARLLLRIGGAPTGRPRQTIAEPRRQKRT